MGRVETSVCYSSGRIRFDLPSSFFVNWAFVCSLRCLPWVLVSLDVLHAAHRIFVVVAIGFIG